MKRGTRQEKEKDRKRVRVFILYVIHETCPILAHNPFQREISRRVEMSIKEVSYRKLLFLYLNF